MTPLTPVEPDAAPGRGIASASSSANVQADVEFRGSRGVVRASVASAPGALHARNEDAHSPLDGRVPLFVVADGVGGGDDAAGASRDLVRALHAAIPERPRRPESLERALVVADRTMRARRGPDAAPSAATVAICVATDASLSRWLVAWVGDCRVYRVTPSHPHAQRLTSDDSYRNLRELPPAGASLDDPARMVGNGAIDAPNVRGIRLEPGEMLAICSDGVHRSVSSSELARVLLRAATLHAGCRDAVDVARAAGSRDDATILVVRRDRTPHAPRERGTRGAAVIALVAGLLLAFHSDGLASQARADGAVPSEVRQP